MKAKYILALGLLILCSVGAMGQKFQVRGVMIEGDTKEALPMVNVQLLTTDSTRVANTNTNDKGEFLLGAKEADEYIVIAKLIGFDPLVRNIKLTKEKPVAKLGNVKMSPMTTDMDEVHVSALARLMSVREDTLLFNTAALRLPPNASLALMMKQLPGIGVDKDGNMTYNGKRVSNILVDGKPFFGDVGTALVNMPTDAVQNVKIYEKTDEEKEFRGELDTNKATVVDLTIKQEYKSKWIANVNGGGGTDKRYIGKIFATNFTDRRRTAVFAQMNNISQNQQVDDNGNWMYWGVGNGLFDYRKAGIIMQWDNGKRNKEGGNMNGNANIDIYHNNNTTITDNNHETFLGNGQSQYSYAHSHGDSRRVGVDANASMFYNIDQNNRLNIRARYSHNAQKNVNKSNSSTFSSEPDHSDNLPESLVGDNIPEEMKQKGIYSQSSNSNGQSHGNTAHLAMGYTHLFKKDGRNINVNLSAQVNDNDYRNNSWQMYRYFNSNAAEPELLKRQRNLSDNWSYSLYGELAYSEPINDEMKLNANYNFSRDNSEQNTDLFDVQTLPLALRPTPGDSLLFVQDIQNSYYSDNATNKHSASLQWQGMWHKIEASLSPLLTLFDEHLDYDRDGVLYNPSRLYLGYGIGSSFRYKFTDHNHIQIYYNGNSNRPSIMELLPIRDTSDPMQETVNNPNLKSGWGNNIFSSLSFFNPKRGDHYGISAGWGNRTNDVVNTEETDPVTGYRRYSKTNVNGNYNMWAAIYTEQPLDTARYWNLSASLNMSYNHNIGYVGALGNSLGLSSINNYSPSARFGLRYRKDIWSMSLSGMWSGQFSRYQETPQYNQNAHTHELSFNPQVDLPFGMKINTQLTYYGRAGYADPLLNHDQWIWNASIGQSFLKSRALTIQLEAVDILQQRTAENSFLSPTSRSFSRTDTFLSYIMLHATYRFSI